LSEIDDSLSAKKLKIKDLTDQLMFKNKVKPVCLDDLDMETCGMDDIAKMDNFEVPKFQDEVQTMPKDKLEEV
jgi:hypothetical protein